MMVGLLDTSSRGRGGARTCELDDGEAICLPGARAIARGCPASEGHADHIPLTFSLLRTERRNQPHTSHFNVANGSYATSARPSHAETGKHSTSDGSTAYYIPDAPAPARLTCLYVCTHY